MANELPWFAAETGTYVTGDSPDPKVSLSGDAAVFGASYPSRTYKRAADDSDAVFDDGGACHVVIVKDANNWAAYSEATWHDDATDYIDVSAGTLVSSEGSLGNGDDVTVIAQHPQCLESVAADTTPQLGGDLDVNGQKIISVSDGDVAIESNGSGAVNITSDSQDWNTASAVAHGETVWTMHNNGAQMLRMQAEGNLWVSSGTTLSAGTGHNTIRATMHPSHTVDGNATYSALFAQASCTQPYDYDKMYGLTGEAYNYGDATVEELGGLQFLGGMSEGTCTHLAGIDCEVRGGGGTIENLYGTKVLANSSVGAVITNFYGAKIDLYDTSADVTNTYALYLSSSSSGTNYNYGLYVASAAPNFFKGNLGVGQYFYNQTPLAGVHVDSATTQLRLSNSSTYYMTVTVNAVTGTTFYEGNFLAAFLPTVAWNFDCGASAQAGALLVSFKNGGVEKANIDIDGIYSGGGFTTAGSAACSQLELSEKSSDPSDPAEGSSILWMSDGTGSGDDGDILIKITAGGSTKSATIVDFSAV